MEYIVRQKSPNGLLVATFSVNTSYEAKPRSRSELELLNLGVPIVTSESQIHIEGLTKDKILTVALPEVLRHCLLQLPASSPNGNVPNLYDRAIGLIEKRLASPMETLVNPPMLERWSTTRIDFYLLPMQPSVLVWPHFEHALFGANIIVPDTAIGFFDEQMIDLSARTQGLILELVAFGLDKWKTARPALGDSTWDWLDWVDYPSWVRSVTGSSFISGKKTYWGYTKIADRVCGFEIEYPDIMHPVLLTGNGIYTMDFEVGGKSGLDTFKVTVVDPMAIRQVKFMSEQQMFDFRQQVAAQMLSPMEILDFQYKAMCHPFSGEKNEMRAIGDPRIFELDGVPAASCEFLETRKHGNHVHTEIIAQRNEKQLYRLTWGSKYSAREGLREIYENMLSTFKFIST